MIPTLIACITRSNFSESVGLLPSTTCNTLFLPNHYLFDINSLHFCAVHYFFLFVPVQLQQSLLVVTLPHTRTHTTVDRVYVHITVVDRHCASLILFARARINKKKESFGCQLRGVSEVIISVDPTTRRCSTCCSTVPSTTERDNTTTSQYSTVL